MEENNTISNKPIDIEKINCKECGQENDIYNINCSNCNSPFHKNVPDKYKNYKKKSIIEYIIGL